MATFEVNKTQASQADSFGNRKKIKESGAYIGFFSSLVEDTTESGSKKLVGEFVSETGGTAKLTMLFKNASGSSEDYPFNKGLAQIQSLFCLLGISNVREARINLDVRNWDDGTTTSKPFKSFPDVLTKRIGVALEKEDGVYNNKPFVKMNIDSFFDPETLKTYSEKANNKEASIVPELLVKYENEQVNEPKPAPKAPTTSASFTAPPVDDFLAAPTSDDFDDGIPF